jgi:hypothetical protein
MIIEEFTARTRANMEIALERACSGIKEHDKRKYVAERIVEQARKGDSTLGALTYAATKASTSVVSDNRRGFPRMA